jgi:hypothetical protein
MNQPDREFTRNFFLAMGVYVILVVLSAWLLKQTTDPLWRFVVAILPMLPLIFGLRSFIRYLGRIDELQQRIQLQAIGFAAGATAMLTLTYGFLENAGLPRLSMIFVFPLLCFLWGGASWYFTRRYQ